MPWPERLSLAHLPTPLWHHDALSQWLDLELWVKRDDMSAGAAAGNKIRKLEFLLHEARAQGCQRVITCGGEQSNHARSTTLCAASLGLKTRLFLRRARGATTAPARGNLLLDRLASAEIVSISAQEYAHVDRLMANSQQRDARAGEKSFVIAEGGSDGLGAFGYVHAMLEVRDQLRAGAAGATPYFDAVVHACGSGGTAAGVALGAALTGVAKEVLAILVCDDAKSFEQRVANITEHARSLCKELVSPAPVRYVEGFQGPGYGIASQQQLEFLRAVATCSGLVLDPVYSGKALFGLAQLPHKPKRALFIHTGGLPGLLAQDSELRGILDPYRRATEGER